MSLLETPRVGLEPTTPRLTAVCSTIELSGIIQIQITISQVICKGIYYTFRTSYKDITSETYLDCKL